MDPKIRVKLDHASGLLRDERHEEALLVLENILISARRRSLKEEEMVCVGLLAPALAGLGRMEEAEQAAAKAKALAVEVGDETGVGHYERLTEQLSVAGGADLQTPLTEAEVDAAFGKAERALRTGQGQAAADALVAIADRARTQEAADIEASARGMLAQALVMMGRTEDALANAERALELAEALGDPGAKGHFQSLVKALGGGGTKAAEEVGRAQGAAVADAAMARAHEALASDEPQEAVDELTPILGPLMEAGAEHAEASVRGTLAQAYLLLGKREEASREATRALEIARNLGDLEAIDAFTQIHALATGWKPPSAKA